MRRLLVLAVMLGAACDPFKIPMGDDTAGAGGGVPEADADADGDADVDADADADGGVDGPDLQPEVTWAQAVCTVHVTGDTFDQWDCSAAANDPQGLFTLSTEGRMRVLDGDTVLLENAMYCDTSTGICSTYFRGDTEGITCATATRWTFEFVVFDEDGHESEPFSVNGTAG
jgi:hypothetical protein